MKRICKILLVPAVVTMFAAQLVSASSDGRSPVIDRNRTASLTLIKLKENDGHVYTGSGKADAQVTAAGMAGIRFGALKIADIENAAGDAAYGTYFTNIDSSFQNLLQENGITLTPQTIGGKTCYETETLVQAVNSMNAISGEVPGEVKLNRFVAGHSATNHMTPTGADGKTVNNGLPLGLYLVAETDYSAYREAAGSGAEELISNPSSPFLVSLPMTSGDDGDASYWLYDVTVYPKNQTIRVPKFIVSEEDGKTLLTSGDYEIGETVHQVIAPDAPAVLHLISDTAENRAYEEYVVADEMEAGLSLKEVTAVKVGPRVASPASLDAFASFETLSLNRDYRLLAGLSGETPLSTSNTKGSKAFRVELLASGLQKLNALTYGGQVVVFFDALLTKDAKDGSAEANKNTPTLTLKHVNTSRASIRGNTPEVYSYRLDVKKNGLTDASKSSFSVRRGTTELSFIEESAGVYHLLDHDLDAAAQAVTRIKPAANGQLRIRGLDADTYELTERTTESGHELLKSVFQVALAGVSPPDGMLRSATLSTEGASTALAVNKGTAGVTVRNRVSLILRTGGAGIGLFLLAAFVTAGAGLLVLRAGKKRRTR